jgi:probable HAF family extracellular repeat protein
MKFRTIALICLVIVASLRSLSSASQLISLGFLDANDQVSTATAVDATGRTVVGDSNLNGQQTAFIWQQSTGMIRLEPSNGALIANAITPDGNTIVGRARTAQTPNGESFITNSTQGFTLIGSLTPTSAISSAQAVSADGQVVAGWSPTNSMSSEAYRWTAQGGFEPLGSLLSGAYYSDAVGVSPDGSVIVGSSDSIDGHQAYRWTQTSGMVGIGDLPGGGFFSDASAVSMDGKVIVGKSKSALGIEAYRWEQSSGMVGLGFLTPNSPFSIAISVTPDGSAIVGLSGFGNDTCAFVWDVAHGMRSLQDLLNADPHLVGDLTGWHLIYADAISENGQAIVGRAFNPQGQVEAFLVLLDAPLGAPEPSSLMICVTLCAVSLCVVRQRIERSRAAK